MPVLAIVHGYENSSGPLLARIDMYIEVPATEYKELASKKPGTSSAEMREQVLLARKAQAERFNSKSRSLDNANLSSRQVREYCPLDRTCQSIMKTSVEVMGLSARAHDKILRVARTIADLDASDNIQPHHLNEAVNYRILDRNLWN
ncbi:MAG: hypothetical protein P8I27_11150 [Pirellulaceae bacterium]|nr:hypothetical protein [Pirellulaceae bacterium]